MISRSPSKPGESGTLRNACAPISRSGRCSRRIRHSTRCASTAVACPSKRPGTSAAAALAALRRLTEIARVDQLEIENAEIVGAPFLPRRAGEARPTVVTIRGASIDVAAGTGRLSVRSGDVLGAILEINATLDNEVLRGDLALRGVDFGELETILGLDVVAAAGTIGFETALTATMNRHGEVQIRGDAAMTDMALAPTRGVTIIAPRVAAKVAAMLSSADTLAGTIELADWPIEVTDQRAEPPVRFVLSGGAAAWSAAVTGGITVAASAPLSSGGIAELALQPEQTGTTRLQLRLADVPAPALEPYASRALGADVAAGRVDVDLRILGSQREGSSVRIVARGLRLAPPGVGGSADTALALLEDPNGTATMELALAPGQESAASLRAQIGERVRALFARLNAAPFAVLAGLIGSDTGLAPAPSNSNRVPQKRPTPASRR